MGYPRELGAGAARAAHVSGGGCWAVPVRSAYACAVLVEAQAALAGLLPLFWAWAKQGQRVRLCSSFGMLAVGALVHICIQYIHVYTWAQEHAAWCRVLPHHVHAQELGDGKLGRRLL
jgi:hypothetical protein